MVNDLGDVALYRIKKSLCLITLQYNIEQKLNRNKLQFAKGLEQVLWFIYNCFNFGQQEKSNRLLNWFIEIKEAHGSVEVTSLKQVDAIKDRGIFKVGNSGKAVKNSHQLVSNYTINKTVHFPILHFINQCVLNSFLNE